MRKAEIKNGVVVNVIEVDSDNVPEWCALWPNVDELVAIGDKFSKGVFSRVEIKQVPTSDDVNRERDSRMSGKFWFYENQFDCDQKSLARIAGAATLAGFAISLGSQKGDLYWHGGIEPFSWISADNSIIEMDAHAMFEFGKAAASNESAHIFAARTLKDMVEIPADFANDKYWP
jgi:hypothetical protein